MADLDFTAALDLSKPDHDLQQFAGHVQSTGAAMEASGQQGGGLLGALGNIGSLATGVGVVATGVGFLGGKLLEAAKAAGDDKASMDRLVGSLQNSAADWHGQTDALDAYISKGQALAFTDDDIRDSLNLLVTQTKNLGDAQKLQAVAMDLARSKNISLAQASKLVMKADQGSEAALAKLGIQIDKNATSEEALAAIHAATAGAADTFAGSTAGSMARLQSSMDDAVEAIGGAILPQLTSALGGVADFVSSDAFQGALQTGVQLLSDGIGGAISFVSGVISPFLPVLSSLGAYFGEVLASGDPLNDFLTNLPAPIQGVAQTLGTLISTVQAVAAGFQTGGIGGALDALAAKFPILQGPIDAFKAAFDGIVSTVTAVAAGLQTGGLSGALDALAAKFPILQGPIDAFKAAFDGISTTVAAVAAGFQAGGLSGALDALAAKFPALQGPVDAFKGVLVLVQDAATQVAAAFSDGGLGGVLDLLGGKVATANPLLQGLQGIVSALTIAVQAGQAVWGVLMGQFQVLADSLGPNLSAMWQNLQPGIAAIQPIIEKLTPVLEAVGAVLGVALVASISALMGILQGLSGALPGIGTIFSGTFQIIDGILNVFSALFTGITNTVKALISGDWQGALNSLSTMFTSLATAGNQIFSGMMTQIQGIFQTAFGFIEGFATGFVETFSGIIEGLASSIGGTAKGIGDGIIGGITGALRNGKDAVINFIKGIAQGAVDAIKDFFGIHSPSRVMADLFGPAGVTGGMALGLDRGAGAVIRAATDLQGRVVDALGGSAALTVGPPTGAALSAAGSGTGAGGSGATALSVTLVLPDGTVIGTVKDVRLSNRKAQERIDLRTASYRP